MTKQDFSLESDPGPSPRPAGRSEPGRETDLVIRAADGVELRADLYVPLGRGRFPAVVERTPYGAHRLEGLGRTYAARGYLFLAVDVRGRRRSGGHFDPLADEEADGAAVLEWIGRHPRCNGKVGTRGHSYCGQNQLLAALPGSPFLKAMVVGVVPADPFHNVPFQGGAYDLADLFWLLSTTGPMGEDQSEVDDEEEEDLERRTDEALESRPFGEVDVRLGQKAKITVDALPDTSFPGTVTEIGNTAKRSLTTGTEGQTNFEVKVEFDQNVPQVRPGMTADVEVETATHARTRAVPIQAVVVRTDRELQAAAKKGKVAARPKPGAGDALAADEDTVGRRDKEVAGVFVVRSGVASFVPVRTGIASETMIEVFGELKEGDTIVSGPYKALFQEFGLTAERIADQARALLGPVQA